MAAGKAGAVAAGMAGWVSVRKAGGSDCWKDQCGGCWEGRLGGCWEGRWVVAGNAGVVAAGIPTYHNSQHRSIHLQMFKDHLIQPCLFQMSHITRPLSL